MECEEYISRRVKLGYVADSPTSIQLVDSIGNQVFDLLPVIQAGETDTSLELIAPTRRIRYNPEEYTRTEGASGCYYDICIPDIAALIDLNELRNVESTQPANGETIVYNSTTGQYEMFDLSGALAAINTRIDNTNTRIDGIASQIVTINSTLGTHTRQISNLFQITSDLQATVTTLSNDVAALKTRVTSLESGLAALTTTVNNLSNTVSALGNRLSAIEGAIYNWANDKNTKIPRGNINVTSGGYNGGKGIFSRAANQNDDINFE